MVMSHLIGEVIGLPDPIECGNGWSEKGPVVSGRNLHRAFDEFHEILEIDHFDIFQGPKRVKRELAKPKWGKATLQSVAQSENPRLCFGADKIKIDRGN